MSRDRQATEQRLIEAVGTLLARDGVRAVGVNAVAREAGVDKVLIYRYFGGLPELLEAYAHSAEFWWTLDEVIGEDLPGPEDDTPAGWAALIMRRHLAALRKRPVTRAILAWEMVEQNELTAMLARVREERSRELGRLMQDRMGPAPDRRWRAVRALIGAGCNYLAVRGPHVERFDGVPLQTDAGWAELDAALDLIFSAVFAALETDAPAGV